MAHHIYHTEVFVLEGRASGEANKYFMLFTREFGMIEASAQGIRKVESKLRTSLTDFSYGTIALVLGKNGWKLTNAIGESNLYDRFKDNKQILIMVSHIFALLKRLLHGEEKNEALYDLVKGAFLFLDIGAHARQVFTSEDIKNTECVLVLNILHLLGYLSENFHESTAQTTSSTSSPVLFATSPDFVWNAELLAYIKPFRQKALIQINRSLQESQL
jgi:DNA repair protein RecO